MQNTVSVSRTLRNVMSKTEKPRYFCLILKDQKSHHIKLEGGNDVSLKAGQTFTFTTTDKSVVGNNEIVAVT